MLDTIFGLFTSFNPLIAGVLLGAGAYFVRRQRGVSQRGVSQRGATTARTKRRSASASGRVPRIS